MMKKHFASILLLAFALYLSACGSKPETDSEVQTEHADSPEELSDEEIWERFYEEHYGGLSDEEFDEMLRSGNGEYCKSGYYEEIIDYWENIRGVTDVANILEPLYFTDMKYYTEADFAEDPPVVIHLAKNEIYARRGYIFKNEDLNYYFRGCKWYTPLTEGEDFDDSVFNDYERKNLELLSELDTL